MNRNLVSFCLTGDVGAVSRVVRRMLDSAGLEGVIFSVVKAEANVASAPDASPPIPDVPRSSHRLHPSGTPDRDELNRVSRLLIAEWERAERLKVSPSYVSTFVDMARVMIADRPRAPEPKEWDAERYDRGDVREDDGYESADYVDGWNDALAACAQGSRVVKERGAHAFEAREDGSLVIYATMPDEDGCPVRVEPDCVSTVLAACGDALARKRSMR